MCFQAFQKIPNELRLRYPTEMAQVGNVPQETLAVGRFGKAVLMSMAFGNTGDAINNISSMKKINENKQAIQRCMACVKRQLDLMQVVQLKLDADISKTQIVASSSSSSSTMQSSVRSSAAIPMAQVVVPPAVKPSGGMMLELTADHSVCYV